MRDLSDELQEPSHGKKLACNIASAGIIILAGVFLLLCGVGVIPLSVPRAVCGTLLCAIGLMLLVSAVVTRNSVSLWLSFCFLMPALVELLVKTTRAGYAELYPLYIAIPAVSSLFTVLLSRAFATHVPIILLFGVVAGIFALRSSGAVSWSVVIPILVLYAGAAMLVMALKKKKDKEDEF